MAILVRATINCFPCFFAIAFSLSIRFLLELLAYGVKDDKAVDKGWKKESAEAGDGLGHVLYQLFKKRR